MRIFIKIIDIRNKYNSDYNIEKVKKAERPKSIFNKTGLKAVSRPVERVHYFGGWVEDNLWRFKFIHQIDAVNFITNFFWKAIQFNNFIAQG